MKTSFDPFYLCQMGWMQKNISGKCPFKGREISTVEGYRCMYSYIVRQEMDASGGWGDGKLGSNPNINK
jgi:hypothetical protein